MNPDCSDKVLGQLATQDLLETFPSLSAPWEYTRSLGSISMGMFAWAGHGIAANVVAGEQLL